MIALQILDILSINFWSLRWGSKSLVRILKYRCIEQKLIRGKKNIEVIKNDIF